MINIEDIKNQYEDLINIYKTKRNIDLRETFDTLLKKEEERKSNQHALNSINERSNALAKEIPLLFKENKKEEAESLKKEAQNIKVESQKLNSQLQTIKQDILDILCQIPNTPDKLVKAGKEPSENEIIYESPIDYKPKYAKPHWEILKEFDWVDFETGVKVTGSGFPIYKGNGAKLERVLSQYFLENNISKGYTEITPPILVNEDSVFGTGQLPDKENQMYVATEDQLYLIPTSEVPLTNIYRDSKLDTKDLPIKLTSCTPCFRREAGSYGKNVRGLNRVHQFEKVELVRIEEDKNSTIALDEMIEHVKNLLLEMGVKFRILRLCGGDLGFASAITYDFEIYSYGQEKWLEISSISNFKAYQAKRLNLRYKSDNQWKYCHTLNGSSLALPRVLAGWIEQNYTPEGILIPNFLRQYWNKSVDFIK